MLVNLNTQIDQYIILLLEPCPHLWRFSLFHPPKLGTSLGQKVADFVCWHVQNFLSFSFLTWETSSKAPFRTYCQYSYVLRLLFSFFFSLLSFSLLSLSLIFIFFSFSSLICTHHEYTHPMVFLHTIGYPNLSLFKIPFPYLKGTIQYLNNVLGTIQVFGFTTSQNICSHPFVGQLWG